MNIRQHLLSAINSGLPAQLTVQAAVPGVTFLDENEFIPFSDLAYNPDLGYYRLSQFPDAANETDNANPETIHVGEWGDDWQAYIWADSDGYLHLLGEMHQVADLYQALGALLHHGQHDPEIISEDDPAWGQSFTMTEAVAEATAYGWTGRYIADRIRQAANDGRIPGARQDDAGRWQFRKAKFRGWLRNPAAHRPGPKP